MTILVRHLILLIAFLLTVLMARSQVDHQDQLYILLEEKDSILFDAAFNRCDPETIKELLTEDFEFFHDKEGITLGRDVFLAPLNERCKTWDSSESQPSKRILLENSLEVYPLYNAGELYGAIQHGVHRFEFLNDMQEYQRGDTAKFTHVWIIEEGKWKIKREYSYDHQMQQENTSQKESSVKNIHQS